MKTFLARSAVVFLLLSGNLAISVSPGVGGAPTVEDISNQILPVLLLSEMSLLHMAGLDAPENEPIVDVAILDLSGYGEANCYDIAFRLYWTATEDVYAKWTGRGPADGETWLLRCGRAHMRYPEKWEEVTIERKSVRDEKGNWKSGFEIKRNPGIGTITWDIGSGLIPFGTKSCWEAQAAVTGEKLRFFDNPNDVPVQR